jgi:hypothetical protein
VALLEERRLTKVWRGNFLQKPIADQHVLCVSDDLLHFFCFVRHHQMDIGKQELDALQVTRTCI